MERKSFSGKRPIAFTYAPSEPMLQLKLILATTRQSFTLLTDMFAKHLPSFMMCRCHSNVVFDQKCCNAV